jgi:hypothetical protein
MHVSASPTLCEITSPDVVVDDVLRRGEDVRVVVARRLREDDVRAGSHDMRPLDVECLLRCEAELRGIVDVERRDKEYGRIAKSARGRALEALASVDRPILAVAVMSEGSLRAV